MTGWEALFPPGPAGIEVIVSASGDTTGVRDVTNINAALAAYNDVKLARGQSFTINASLVINSGNRLDATGATITLVANSNVNMIHNAAWVAGSGRDKNIEILGGAWVSTTIGAAGQQRFAILMQRVDGLNIHDLTVTQQTGAQAGRCIVPYACTNFLIQRVQVTTGGVGIQVCGATSNGLITDIAGTTGDDGVALSPIDGAAYQNGDLGNASFIDIERISIVNTGGTTVKLLAGNIGGTGITVSNCTVTDVNANTTAQQAVALFGDPGYPETVGGSLIDIAVDNVANAGSGNAFLLYYVNVRGLTVSRIQYPAGGGHAVQISNGVTIEDMTVQNCCFTSVSLGYPIFFVASAPYPVVTLMRVVDCRLNNTTKVYGLISQGSASCVLTNLTVENLYVDNANYVLGDLYGTINMRLENVTAPNVNALAFLRAGSVINLVDARGLSGAHSHYWSSSGTITGIVYSNGAGAPTFAGQVGDIYIRQDGGALTTLYRCTVAGNDGAATWVGIL